MKIVVNGQLINYSDEGNGKVIVMLHGWGTNLHTFDDLATHLVKKYRIIRVDFPGFGESPQPLDPWGVNDYAQILSAFLQKHEAVDVYAIIAHSFGGRVAIKMLGTSLLDVQRLILVGSGGIKHSSSSRQRVFKAIAKTGGVVSKLPGIRKARGAMRQKLYSSAGASDYLESGGLKETFLKVIHEDLRDDASRITNATLLIWGENDDQTPVSDANIFHRTISSSKLVVYPGVGHFTHLDEPEKVKQEIESFLL